MQYKWQHDEQTDSFICRGQVRGRRGGGGGEGEKNLLNAN